MSAPLVIFNTEKRQQTQKEKQMLSVINRCRDFSQKAEAYGIKLAIEPEPGQVTHGIEETLLLLSEVNSPNLGVNLDIGHAYITDSNLLNTIDQLQNSIFHTHIEDISNGVHKHLLPGEGDINLKAVIGTLQKIGYQGSLTFDLFGLGADYQRYVREAFEYISDLMQGTSG